MSSNLGWLFYKDYFRGLDFSNLKNSSDLLNRKINGLLEQNPNLESNADKHLLGNTHFKATTTYPGLLLGSGNIHELPDVKGQLMLGFNFDYTTGLPVIAGSSIKGVLRSAFENRDYISELLDNRFNSDEINEIEKEIFDNGDIFFDAVVIATGGRLLADDYLAPHNEELKEPIPLRFLKVAPNVSFRFDFELKNGVLSKDEKKELFKTILEDLGVGAKTNVGYGKFENISEFKTEQEIEIEKREEDKKLIETATTIEKLEEFIRNHPMSELLDEAKSRLEKLHLEESIKKIKEAFETVKNNKNNKNYVDSFIEKYKDNELAKEFVEKAKEFLNPTQNRVSNSEFDISSYSKFKPLESYLKKFNSLSEEQVKELEKHLLNMKEKIKRKKFPFGTLGKFIDKDRLNEIADKLGLK